MFFSSSGRGTAGVRPRRAAPETTVRSPCSPGSAAWRGHRHLSPSTPVGLVRLGWRTSIDTAFALGLPRRRPAVSTGRGRSRSRLSSSTASSRRRHRLGYTDDIEPRCRRLGLFALSRREGARAGRLIYRTGAAIWSRSPSRAQSRSSSTRDGLRRTLSGRTIRSRTCDGALAIPRAADPELARSSASGSVRGLPNERLQLLYHRGRLPDALPRSRMGIAIDGASRRALTSPITPGSSSASSASRGHVGARLLMTTEPRGLRLPCRAWQAARSPDRLHCRTARRDAGVPGSSREAKLGT
jgi:hypothetical protein